MSESIWNEMEFVAKVDVTEIGFGPFGIHTTLTTQGCLTCKTIPGHCGAIAIVLQYFKKKKHFYTALPKHTGNR